MNEKLDILENKILQLIDKYNFLKKENENLKLQVEEFKKSRDAAVERIDNLIKILKNEGVIEEDS